MCYCSMFSDLQTFVTFFLQLLGLFSNIMRDMANLTGDNPKWIVLDGDIDPMWIESLNTVMDDNKVTNIPVKGTCTCSYQQNSNIYTCLNQQVWVLSKLCSSQLHLQQANFNAVCFTECVQVWLIYLLSCMQVLTLASNERVPLTPSMRLMFEIGHLKAATPATVSRAGILFANPSDLGWNP